MSRAIRLHLNSGGRDYLSQKRQRGWQRFCGERFWVFVQEFEVNSSGTVRMFEGKSYVFCLSSGTDEKFEGHLIKKPTRSECKIFARLYRNLIKVNIERPLTSERKNTDKTRKTKMRIKTYR